jgi:hypothetical protein
VLTLWLGRAPAFTARATWAGTATRGLSSCHRQLSCRRSSGPACAISCAALLLAARTLPVLLPAARTLPVLLPAAPTLVELLRCVSVAAPGLLRIRGLLVPGPAVALRIVLAARTSRLGGRRTVAAAELFPAPLAAGLAFPVTAIILDPACAKGHCSYQLSERSCFTRRSQRTRHGTWGSSTACAACCSSIRSPAALGIIPGPLGMVVQLVSATALRPLLVLGMPLRPPVLHHVSGEISRGAT